ncbi:hypothetical protein [Cyanobium sp. CH-040]|uniref:hypothetical protein n=1 Tax=Cyanobium sp. CH-040 TaxID=2823708 RepID=UPI0020CFE51F|nr:hypothetical protein [Cyanobium sp. CH-040]MCP9927712.1 hypothetical protein [Cyanobium sp. CH-040]
MTPDPASPWRVEIVEHGRSGRVVYQEAAGQVAFHWEFSGGDAIASLWVGAAEHWNSRVPWAAGRRAEILERVALEVVRRRAPSCRALIEARPGFIEIRAG